MSPVRQLDEVIERLKQLADGRMEGDAQTAALLKSEVIEPVATVGTGDQSSTAAAKRKNQSALARRGAAPERYRRAVEEYRRLSAARPKQ